MRACALDHKSIRSTYMGDKFIFGCPSPPPLSNTKLIVVRGGAVNGYGGGGGGGGGRITPHHTIFPTHHR